MENDLFYIATENYKGENNIYVEIGNQFQLIEQIDDDTVKVKAVENNKEIILPRKIMEFMSLPTMNSDKPLTRSFSSVKERVSSLNAEKVDIINKYSTFGHGSSERKSLEIMTKDKNDDEDEGIELVNNTNDNIIPHMRHGNQAWELTLDDDDGAEVYINKNTGERWRVTQDQESGRQYYYEENLRISLWNLPGHEKQGEPTYGEVAVRPLDEVLEEEGACSDGEEGTLGSGGPLSAMQLASGQFNELSVSLGEASRPLSEGAMSDNLTSHGVNTDDDDDNSTKFNLRKIKKEHISAPLQNKLMRTEKAGFVEKVKISDPSAKEIHAAQKKYLKCYMVLTGPELYFYKDAKSAQPRGNQPYGRVDLKLRMQNLQFSQPSPTEILASDNGAPDTFIHHLLRLSSAQLASIWLQALQMAKQLLIDDMYSHNADTIIVTPDKRLINMSARGTNSSPDDQDDQDKQNIRNLLNKFLRKRPNADYLEAKGILKPESVFGSSLDLLCEQEKSKIPEFVYRCILSIESRGLNSSGIYRISGNQAKIQKLRLAVDDHRYHLNSDSLDLETLTGAFKLFFKELREPLLDEEFCNKMSELLTSRRPDKKNPYKDVNLNSAIKLVSKMKRSHYETAKALFAHLKKVSEQHHKNLMDVSNLSMVWGPNLYHTTGQASTRLAVILMTRNQIIDYLIQQNSSLFDK